ncbi:MAG: 30S ribosomal protein S2 [Candidatus Levybacteria bacterium RIFCSPHIGHO2_01_FULL_37_33]|nr:MAG: 30S ribosomal protein S2 [Candidatus Levybacteria bacterium RIFCSPHIGHO2_01_FULL_37_33]OGH16084.1 MAG: 30S ribosomal protein S2 [Candidatus Levybacteria bacterium RIFCSPHIGHO2_02_FULL_37_11]OGH29625.1 MAG: 30S ribosomal protein S2 [Candidatus Levybacteria bacterium RIFCSPHIGHO2_12_FULL_37_12]
MREIILEELLEAGCHFGHQVTRSNPKARDYIFEARDNIHIIDLGKTKAGLEEAGRFIFNLAAKNGSLIVVGTKRQAQGIVEEEVKKAKQQVFLGKTENEIFFVTQRWVGGTLTNFSEVVKNFKKLKDLLEKLASEEERSKYTKKEVGLWEKERQKLASLYGGIADLKKIPDAVFVIDSHLETLAIDEAGKMGVATVAIVDTNANPQIVDYPIPANDDATGSIKLITSYIIDAWIEGKRSGDKKTATTETQKKTEIPKLSDSKKLSDSVVARKVSKKNKIKTAATKTQKVSETQKRKKKNVNKK